MKKLLLIIALLCVPLARAQDPTYPVSYSRGGNITTSSANCDPTACIGIGLPTPSASVITVGLTGTWSGTLSPEESQDGGRTFTSAGTGLTSNGTTSYVIAGFTSFRVRAGTLASGNAGVNFSVSNAPNGGVTSGTADPTGTACGPNTLYVQTTTGKLYSCDAGVFALVSGGSSVSITATAPIVVTPSPITGTGVASCPTCTTSAAAITNNVLAKGSGGAQGLANSSVTDNGTTVSTPEPITALSVSTGGTPPAITAGTGGVFGSAEGTAPSVGFPAATVDGCYADSTQHAYLCSFNNGTAFKMTQTICSGSQALGTSLIASGAAATTVTITCTGLASTDDIQADFNGSPLAVTGYVPSANGMLTIIKWPTSNTINISVVNNTASSITPGAITLNYRVTR